MHVFSATASIEILDGLACAFLAMAAALRARSLGANLAGVLVLACISSLSAGLGREFILHGQQGGQLIFAQLPQAAFIGAIAGLFLYVMARKMVSQLFFFMDTLSMSLTAALAASLSAPELGAIGALALGVSAGLLPGLIRDVSLGDSAIFLEQDWYAACAILSTLWAIMLIILPAFWVLPAFFVHRLGEWAVLSAVFLALCLRYWRGRKMISD